MYVVKYGTRYLHDPFSDEAKLSDISLSAQINASGDCSFTMAPNHPLYNDIQVRSLSDQVFVMQDNTILFDGYISGYDDDFDGTRTVTCSGCLSYLGDVCLRPYSTIRDPEDGSGVLYAPESIDGMFEFYISQYNEYADSSKQFLVGKNEGAVLSTSNQISVESSDFPTVADEITDVILNQFGGYLFVRHSGNKRYIDLFSECVDVNAQIVDFGVNILDFTKSVDLSDFYTVIRPSATVNTNSDDGAESSTDIDLTGLPDNESPYPGLIKKGDVLYNQEAAEKYGYVEYAEDFGEVADVNELVEKAASDLKAKSKILPTIEVKAIDLSLYQEGNTPLVPGQLVRIRSVPHGIDEYMLLNSMDIDVSDPSQTTYTFGIPINTLTGEQSKRVQELNANINHSLDAVGALDQATKDQAVQIGNIKQVANDASKKADNAQNTANNAQNTADNAQNTANNVQQTANSNKQEIDSIKGTQTEYEKQLEQMQQGVTDATEEIGHVNERIEGMNSEIESAKSGIDSLRSSTETEFQNVKQSVSDVQSDVDVVTQKAADLASDLDGTKATVEQVTTDLGEVRTTVSNAATKADQALQVSTSASQTATEAKTTATSAYQDAQSALTQSSAASQTANAVKTELETNYSTTDEIAEQYATKSLVEQTSQSITSTVEATYATKATVEALENIANNAVQTWTGSGVPTLSNKPASDWTTAELKSQHSGDIYYDSDTGYSYRFGSPDGRNYSWSLIKDTDISKAVADAAKAQQTAEGVSDEVTQLKTDIPATYATKTEVKQTTDSIKSSVSEVATTANSALSKATTVEQTANGLQTTVTEQAKKLDGAVTTISQVSQKVDSVSSTITQVSDSIDALGSSVSIKNPSFETGDLTDWTTDSFVEAKVSTGTAKGKYRFEGQLSVSSGGFACLKSSNVTLIPGHTYRLTVGMAHLDQTANVILCGRRISDNNRDHLTGYSGTFYAGPWHAISGKITVPSDYKVEDSYRIELIVSRDIANRLMCDDFTITDITDAKTANDTANSALSKSSSVEQSLNSFKTSVSQTYETKNDALSKQSSLQQSVNNLRTEVSETYTTKTEFNNLQIGGTNLIRNSNFSDSSSDWSDWGSPSTREIVTINSKTWAHIVTSKQAYQGYQQRTLASQTIHGGEPYTFSCLAYAGDSSSSKITVGIHACLSNKQILKQFWHTDDTLGSDPKRIVYTFAIPENCEQLNVMVGYDKTDSVHNMYFTDIKLEVGAKPTDWSPAPEDLLTDAEAAKTYSTKSYVDQTARTVSLGVVEEYKNGQHGSALATQSDITAAKDSITSTVSQTYATKNEFNNLQVGGTNIARDTQAFGRNGVSSTEEGYLKNYVNRTNGTYKGLTVRNIISSDETNMIVCEYLVTNVKHSEYYTLSFWAKGSGKIRAYFHGPSGYIAAKAVSASNGSGNTAFSDGVWNMTVSSSWQRYFVVYQTAPSGGTSTDKYMLLCNDNDMESCDVCGVMIERGNKASDWSASPLDVSATYATKSEVKQTSDSLTVSIESNVSQINSVATDLQNTKTAVTDRLEDVDTSIGSVSNRLDEEIETRSAYMRFEQTTSGDPLLELGASSSSSKVRLTNEKLSFVSNDSEVAYVSNDRLNINNATINNELVMGNFVWIPRSDGSLSLTHI